MPGEELVRRRSGRVGEDGTVQVGEVGDVGWKKRGEVGERNGSVSEYEYTEIGDSPTEALDWCDGRPALVGVVRESLERCGGGAGMRLVTRAHESASSETEGSTVDLTLCTQDADSESSCFPSSGEGRGLEREQEAGGPRRQPQVGDRLCHAVYRSPCTSYGAPAVRNEARGARRPTLRPLEPRPSVRLPSRAGSGQRQEYSVRLTLFLCPREGVQQLRQPEKCACCAETRCRRQLGKVDRIRRR